MSGKRERVNRADLLTGGRSRVPSTTANPFLPAEPADPFTARPIDPATVTGSDAERLAAFEAAVEAAQDAADRSLQASRARFAIEAGTALRAIQADALHRAAGYAAFDDYTRARWRMSASRAYQLMDAAPVMLVVSKIFDTAPIESQAVALAPVLVHHGEDAVRIVMDQTRQESKKVTAATLRQTAGRLGYIPTQDQDQQQASAETPAGAAAVIRMEQALALLRRAERELSNGVMAAATNADAERGQALTAEAARISQQINTRAVRANRAAARS